MVNNTEYILKDENLIVKFANDLDHHNTEIIREQIDKIIDDNNKIINVIMDFTNVGFMDSSGIGVIMGRYKKVCFNGGRLFVVGINNVVDKIFTLSALYRITSKYKDVEEVLDVLKRE